MNGPKMEESQALKYELKIRFQKKPRRCRKMNDSYIGEAQRIVCVSNNTFYYYPTIQEFQDMDFDKLQYVIPKAGVKLDDIFQLKFPPRRTNERNFFSIILPKNKILKFTKAMKEIIVDQFAQGQQTWTFNFDYDIIALPEREQKQKTTLQKELMKEKQKQEEERRLMQEEQKQLKEKMMQEYNSLVQAEEMQIDEDPEYKKKRQEQMQKQNRQRLIKECDELFFTRAYRRLNTLIYENEQDLTKVVKEEMEVLKVIGNFKQRAQLTARQFIDEWPYSQTKIKKNTYYQINNMQLKIGDKNINQEFLSNYWVANAIHQKQIEFTKTIRVPLIAFIKYKGFKILVRAWTPMDLLDLNELDDAIIHGNCSDNWKSNFLMMDSLSTIADSIKLKPYNSEVHYQRVQIHLGTSLKVVETQTDPFSNIKKLDPQRLSQKNNDYRLYYLYDIDEVFPIDLELEENVNQSFIRLRPEFVQKYVDPELEKTRLTGGSLLYSIEDEEGEKDDVIVAKAAQHFKFVTLYNFVKALDRLQFVPYNSQSMQKVFKAFGVNMRYLGTVFKSTSLPYMKVMTEIECIARQIKKIYRQFQLEFCENNFKEDSNMENLINEAFSHQSPPSLKKMRIKQLKKLESERSIFNAIDYLNLVFSSTQETFEFWKIIKEKVLAYYKVQISDYMSLPHGYLLKSVLYHCGFDIKLTEKTTLFMNSKPFVVQDWDKFTCKIHSFDFPNMKVYTKIDTKPQYSADQNKSHLQMSLLVKRALKNYEMDVLIQLTKYRQNFQPPRQFYSIQNFFYYLLHPTPENFDNALKAAHFILPSTHPFFIQMYLKYSQLKTSKLDIISLKKAAQSHAIRNLGITHKKTAQILTNFNQLQYLNNLKKAEIGVAKQNRSKLYLQIVKEEIHLGRLLECSTYVRKCIEIFGATDVKLNQIQIDHYFEILLLGMEANYKMRRIENLVKMSEFMWIGLEKYWQPKYLLWFKRLLQMVIKCFLEAYEKKLYLYKLVIVLKDEVNHKMTEDGLVKILMALFEKCKESKNHVNWTKELFINLEFGYLELNFANDFFTNFWQHAMRLANDDLEEGLKGVHDLLHILGQDYFEDALLDRIYSFEKGVEMFSNDPKETKQKMK